MAYSEIVLAPGSGRPISLGLLDGNGNPINFSVGTWSAHLIVVRYPRDQGVPFAHLHTDGLVVNDPGEKYSWLTLTADSRLRLDPSPIVTREWEFTRYHYDCYVKGPNVSSVPDRVAHGPFKMDW